MAYIGQHLTSNDSDGRPEWIGQEKVVKDEKGIPTHVGSQKIERDPATGKAIKFGTTEIKRDSLGKIIEIGGEAVYGDIKLE